MQASEAQQPQQRAEHILRRHFAAADGETVYRNTALNEIGGPGHARHGERRLWAEAWQMLERGGLICKEPDARDSDVWFLTSAGRAALVHGDIIGSLQLAGVHL